MKERPLRLARVLCLLALACFISDAKADSITKYQINFAADGGVTTNLPTDGMFTYDSTNQTFLSFSVMWNGLTFDFTSDANNPSVYTPAGPACLAGLSGGAATFAFITGACVAPANPDYWYSVPGLPGLPINGFAFNMGSVCCGPFGSYTPTFLQEYQQSAPDPGEQIFGNWTVTELADTPEPSFLLPGMALLAVTLMRRRMRRRVRS